MRQTITFDTFSALGRTYRPVGVTACRGVSDVHVPTLRRHLEYPYISGSGVQRQLERQPSRRLSAVCSRQLGPRTRLQELRQVRQDVGAGLVAKVCTTLNEIEVANRAMFD